MIENILIPTDFSKNSWNAVKYALSLFKDFRCHFYLLHVIQPYIHAISGAPFAPVPEYLNEDARTRSREDLENLLSRVKKEFPGYHQNFTLLPKYGSFIDVIREQVDVGKIDLIVMGTKGASGLKEVIVGSHTGDVITKVRCAVLAVPEKAIFKPPQEVVFPTDYTIPCTEKVLAPMILMADRFQSTIRILNVTRKEDESLNEEQKFNRALLEFILGKRSHSFHQLSGTNLEIAIEHFTQSRDTDLIIMKAKKINLFQRLLFEPSVAKISYHTRIPFLVLHEKGKT